MEEIETASPDVARWHHELAYEAGPWAVAFAISRSTSGSISRYFRTFYPLVDQMGWQAALCRYTSMEDIDAFYGAFDAFMQRPLADRLRPRCVVSSTSRNSGRRSHWPRSPQSLCGQRALAKTTQQQRAHQSRT